MGLFNQFPFTNFHEMNLDWIINQIKNNTNDIKTNSDNIKTNTENIEKIENEIGEFKDRFFLCLGDSYGAFQDASLRHWPEYFAEYANIDNNHIFNYCVNGAAFAHQYGNNYIDHFNTFISENPDYGKITDIIICGGLNDSSPYEIEHLDNAINAFVIHAKNMIKNCEIHIGYCGYGNDNNETIAGRTAQFRLVACEIYQSAGKYGCKILNGTQYVLHDKKLMFTDEIHPNEAGAKKLGEAVFGCMTTGYYSTIKRDTEISISSANATITGKMSQLIDNNTITSYSAGILSFSFTSPVKIDAYGSVKIADINQPYSYNSLLIPITAYFIDSGEGKIVNGYILLKNNGLYINCFNPITSATVLQFCFSYTGSTMMN